MERKRQKETEREGSFAHFTSLFMLCSKMAENTSMWRQTCHIVHQSLLFTAKMASVSSIQGGDGSDLALMEWSEDPVAPCGGGKRGGRKWAGA